VKETPRRQVNPFYPQITQISADYDFFTARLCGVDLASPAEAGFAKAGGGNIQI
jgi:hypothetical protein